jgi:hypothetical protein
LLSGVVKATVAPGATVKTDAWAGHAPLRSMGHRHQARTQGEASRAGVILPRVHRALGNLQTWLRGAHHGVSVRHLQADRDEITFRLNRRGTPMAAVQTLLGLGGQRGATTYQELHAVESTG